MEYTFKTRAGSRADLVEVMLFCGDYSQEMSPNSPSLNYPVDGTFCHSCQCQQQFATFINGEMQYLGE